MKRTGVSKSSLSVKLDSHNKIKTGAASNEAAPFCVYGIVYAPCFYDRSKNSHASNAWVRYRAGACSAPSVAEGRLSTNMATERMQTMTPSTRQATIFPQKLTIPVMNIKIPKRVAIPMFRSNDTSPCTAEMTEEVPSAIKIMLMSTRVRLFDDFFFLVAILISPWFKM